MLIDFLNARIAEDEANPDCWGAGEYVSCRDWSERHEREAEAKRQIVAEHEGAHGCVSYIDNEDNRECHTLRYLATVYADHPDYHSEWAP